MWAAGVPKPDLASGGWFRPCLAASLTPLLFSTGKVGSEMLQVMNWTSGDSSDREASGNPVQKGSSYLGDMPSGSQGAGSYARLSHLGSRKKSPLAPCV